MTSVNFNVGFSNERSSSRVLKPPGGGHTDIFGVSGDCHEQKKHQIENKSENEAASTAVIESNKTEGETNEQESLKQNDEEVNGKSSDDNKLKKDESQPEIPKRTRVPPGGFSSGLW